MSSTPQQRRKIALTEGAGVRQATVARSTGTLVVVYDGDEAGLDTDAGRWQTVCDDHGHIISHETLATAKAFASEPETWCGVCSGEYPDPDTGETSWWGLGYAHGLVGAPLDAPTNGYYRAAENYLSGYRQGDYDRAAEAQEQAEVAWSDLKGGETILCPGDGRPERVVGPAKKRPGGFVFVRTARHDHCRPGAPRVCLAP